MAPVPAFNKYYDLLKKGPCIFVPMRKTCFIILCLAAGCTYAPAQEASMQSWKYKKPIVISNKESKTLIDHQVSFTFSPDTLIAEGKLNPDLSDIRITSADGLTPLCFWIDVESNTRATVVVKLPRLDAQATEIIFMLYGNASAQAAANPDCTFLLHDDFNGNAVDRSKWKIMGKQAPAVGNGKIVFAAKNTNQMILTQGTYERPLIVEMKVLNAWGSTISFSQVVRSEFGWIGGYSLDLNQKENTVQIDLLEPSVCEAYSVSGIHAGPEPAGTTKGIWSLSWITDNEIMAHWPGGNINHGNIFIRAGQMKVGMGVLACNTGKDESGMLEVDWIHIRKYTQAPPNVLIGNEIPEKGPPVDVAPGSGIIPAAS
jgi:hypothetical protein